MLLNIIKVVNYIIKKYYKEMVDIESKKYILFIAVLTVLYV